MDPAPTYIDLARSQSTAVKTATRSAPLLEYHLGAIVAACAGMIGEAVGEFQDGGLTPRTKGQAGEFIAELFRLRQYMIVDWPDFDRIARERGVEMLVACGAPSSAAEFLVTEALAILSKIVHDELH